jgi:hypothetical protein
MRFEILTAVRMSKLVLCIVILFELTRKYQCFGGIYCFYLQGLDGPSNLWLVRTSGARCYNPEDQHQHKRKNLFGSSW